MADSSASAYKIIVVGDVGVGKTCFARRLAYPDQEFAMQAPSVGMEQFPVTLDVDNEQAMVHLWDTAGQERFRTISASFYRKSAGVIVAYDCTVEDSFHTCSSWLQELSRYQLSQAPKVLCAMKTDVIDGRQVTTERGKGMAQELGLVYVEVSAATNLNLTEPLKVLVRAARQDQKSGTIHGKSRPRIKTAHDVINLRSSTVSTDSKTKSGCC
eukprot:m.15239 g.15239  ORF g.15239 m.15239 type:complete len:213 (-) comp10435_c0_seq2:43-681(-)